MTLKWLEISIEKINISKLHQRSSAIFIKGHLNPDETSHFQMISKFVKVHFTHQRVLRSQTFLYIAKTYKNVVSIAGLAKGNLGEIPGKAWSWAQM